MGGVAGQQDAASLVAVGLPGVPDKPGQPLRIGHRQVAAEDPPGAGAQFVEGHRSAQVGGGVVLAGVDDEDAGSSVLVEYGQRRERVGASRGAGLPHELQAADPRYLHRATAPGELRRRQAHGADAGYLRRGGAGETDPGLLAYQAVRAVAAHEGACAQLVVAAGTADVEGDRVVMRGQRRQFMPAPDGPAEFGEPRLQHLLQPALRHRQDVHRAGPEPGEVQLQRTEREARYRPGKGGLLAEPIEQAAVIQHRHDLACQAVALGGLVDPGQSLQHDRVAAAQPELAGQYESDRSAAGDHDVCLAGACRRLRGHG